MKRQRTRLALLACVGCGLAGCGGSDGDESLGVENVAPQGSVGGRVIDATTRAPIAGVSATVIAGGAILPADGAKTDDKGRFAIAEVPSGNLILRLEGPAGYAPVEFTANLASSAGEFPVSNATLSVGPIGLIPLNDDQAPLRVKLLKADGTLAASVKAQLKAAPTWVDFSDTVGSARGNIVVDGTTSAAGMLSFSGIPHYGKLAGLVGTGGISDTVELHVPPFDSNDDGLFDFLGATYTFQANSVTAAVPTFVLQTGANAALEVMATSLPALKGEAGNRILATGGTVFVTFNWPLTEAGASLFDEVGTPQTVPTVKLDGSSLTVSFAELQAGREYNLNLWAVGDAEGRVINANFGAPFFTATEQDKIVAQLSKDTVNKRVNIKFSEPLGTGVPGGTVKVFYDFDIDGSGTKGDAPGEKGSQQSSYVAVPAEVDPPGKAGLSGFSTYWHLKVPVATSTTKPLPSGTILRFAFGAGNTPVTRATGRVIDDITTTLP